MQNPERMNEREGERERERAGGREGARASERARERDELEEMEEGSRRQRATYSVFIRAREQNSGS